MSRNVTEEIRAVEDEAKKVVQNAKTESVRVMAAARAAADVRLKEARHGAMRRFRERIAVCEEDAERTAQTIVAEGEAAARTAAERADERVTPVGGWIAEEVMRRYGCRDR